MVCLLGCFGVSNTRNLSHIPIIDRFLDQHLSAPPASYPVIPTIQYRLYLVNQGDSAYPPAAVSSSRRVRGYIHMHGTCHSCARKLWECRHSPSSTTSCLNSQIAKSHDPRPAHTDWLHDRHPRPSRPMSYYVGGNRCGELVLQPLSKPSRLLLPRSATSAQRQSAACQT